MLVDYQPLSVELSVNIGNAYREIQGLAIFVPSVCSEDAVPIREIPLSFRLPIGHLGVKCARVSCQEASQSFR
jgi:hypothetical protein